MKKNITGLTLLEVLFALALSAVVVIGVFQLLLSLEKLHHQSWVLSKAQQENNFLTYFLREKIQSAGDWSCVKKSPGKKSIPARAYNSDLAFQKLGLTIKKKTDLLQLHECVRYKDQLHYLPVDFFIANTYRINSRGKEIDALFFKIAHHHRQELITGMRDFQLQLGIENHAKTAIVRYDSANRIHNHSNVGAIVIDYVLFNNQPGEIYAAIRKK